MNFLSFTSTMLLTSFLVKSWISVGQFRLKIFILLRKGVKVHKAQLSDDVSHAEVLNARLIEIAKVLEV